jgi:hypothetical protein
MVLGNSVSPGDLEKLFVYGGVHGYGGERGDGEGRYVATLTPLEHQEGHANGRLAHTTTEAAAAAHT